LYVDAAKEGYLASFIEQSNRDHRSNAKFELRGVNNPRVDVVAKRDIANGEEILINYGDHYWEHMSPNADYGHRVVRGQAALDGVFTVFTYA